MAHHLDYYFPAGDLLTENVLAGALTALRDDGFEYVELRAEYSGGGAAGGWLFVGGADTGLSLRCHVGDRYNDSQWAFLRELPGAPAEENASGSFEVVMSGDVDMEVFGVVRRFLKVDLGAAEYDEISGFTD